MPVDTPRISSPTELANPEWQTRYVDPANGAAGNDGRSPETAIVSIQAAYDDLVTAAEVRTGVSGNTRLGVGRIVLAPGGHDVGAGLAFKRTRPVVMEGIRPNRRHSGAGLAAIPARAADNSYLYTSAGTPPTELISMATPATSVNGYGFRFAHFDMWFDAAGIDYGIYAPCVNFLTIQDVGFIATQTGTDKDMIAVYGWTDTALGDDTSWWRISDCYSSRIALCQIGKAGVTLNHNQHVIKDNACFGWGKTETTAKPLIAGSFLRRCTIRDNNIEGAEVGIHLGPETCAQNIMVGNGGEQVAKFIRIEKGIANIIIDHGETVPAAGDSLVSIEGSSTDNVSILAALTGQGSLYDSGGYSDTSTSKDNAVLGYSSWNSRMTVKGGLSSFSDATRPSASDYHQGASIWNTDDNAPNWSDETNWRDATGAIT